MEKEWKLSSLDLFSLNMVIKGAWVYRDMPSEQVLSASLTELIKYYPHLTGHYDGKGKRLVWDNEYSNEPTLKVVNKPAVSLEEVIGHKEKVWSLVPEYNLKQFIAGKAFPFSASLVTVNGGAVLIIQGAHALMDGHSFYRLAEHWAALSKGEKIVPMVVNPQQLPAEDSLTREEVTRQVIEDGWIKVSFSKLLKMIWNTFRANSIKEDFIQEVSQEEITRLKQESGAGTHAVLCALAAHEIMKKAHSSEPFKVITVADLRGHLTGVSPEFMGNLSQPFITKNSFSPALSIAELAQAIQKENAAILESNALEKNVKLSICASYYKLPYFFFDTADGFNPHPKSVYVNNQLKFKANELDFGAGRTLYAYPAELSDTIKFWQPVSGGPVQIIYKGFISKLMRH